MIESPKPLRDDLLTATVQAPTFLTSDDIAALCRVSKSTVSRWSRFGTGGFPKPTVNAGNKMHLFLTADYVQWVAAKAAHRDGVPMPVDKRTMKRQRYA